VVTDMQATGRGRARELAHRSNGQIDVSLLWRKLDNSLTLVLVEVATGVEFELPIPSEDALDAFNHPYAYLPGQTVEAERLLAA
jgi:hypothetical protein